MKLLSWNLEMYFFFFAFFIDVFVELTTEETEGKCFIMFTIALLLQSTFLTFYSSNHSFHAQQLFRGFGIFLIAKTITQDPKKN